MTPPITARPSGARKSPPSPTPERDRDHAGDDARRSSSRSAAAGCAPASMSASRIGHAPLLLRPLREVDEQDRVLRHDPEEQDHADEAHDVERVARDEQREHHADERQRQRQQDRERVEERPELQRRGSRYISSTATPSASDDPRRTPPPGLALSPPWPMAIARGQLELGAMRRWMSVTTSVSERPAVFAWTVMYRSRSRWSMLRRPDRPLERRDLAEGHRRRSARRPAAGTTSGSGAGRRAPPRLRREPDLTSRVSPAGPPSPRRRARRTRRAAPAPPGRRVTPRLPASAAVDDAPRAPASGRWSRARRRPRPARWRAALHALAPAGRARASPARGAGAGSA